MKRAFRAAQKYLLLFSCSVRQRLVYRKMVFIWVLSTLLSFAIQISLWTALIGVGVKQGTTLADMTTYLLITLFVQVLTNSSACREIERVIQDGSVAMYFIRPMSFKLSMFAMNMGGNFFELFTAFLPALAAALLFCPISPPASGTGLMLTGLALLLGVGIQFEVTFMTGLLAFWVQRTWFLTWYLNGFTMFFGGTMVPLWFYPSALQALSRFLPFRYVSFSPINLFLGRTAGAEAALDLAIAAVWLAALHLLSRLVWNAAARKVTVNGG